MAEKLDAEVYQKDGRRHFRDGMYPEALAAFEQALEGFEESGDRINAAETMNDIGVVHRTERRPDDAIAALEKARLAFEELGDGSRAAQALANTGGVYAIIKERDKAIETYRQASEIFAELGDGDRQGATLLALGSVQLRQARWGDAMATYYGGLSALTRPSIFQRLFLALLKTALNLMGR